MSELIQQLAMKPTPFEQVTARGTDVRPSISTVGPEQVGFDPIGWNLHEK